MAQENRAFMQRAVRYLVDEAGIRQIIDIGTGIPAAGNVHEVAQQIDPSVRVAYVDNDPIVHVHASAWLTGQGSTSIVLADLRDPQAILGQPKVRDLIDPAEPTALILHWFSAVTPKSPPCSRAGIWSSPASCRCRCGGETASRPRAGSWRRSASTAGSAARARCKVLDSAVLALLRTALVTSLGCHVTG
jgi:hypothetical protein